MNETQLAGDLPKFASRHCNNNFMNGGVEFHYGMRSRSEIESCVHVEYICVYILRL